MKTKKHSARFNRIKNSVLLLISLLIIGIGIGIIWLSTLQIPDLHAFEQRKVVQSTKIYDRTGQVLLYDIHQDAKRTVVDINEISPFIKNATIAIEDTNFYSHHGIEPKSILRAVIADITTSDYSQGGSTITQQVIKNSLLTKDKTITRKLKEWVLAIKLENVLPKDQILSTYLNENAYGGNIYGVEEASRAFFGKSAKDVSLAQAAYIAALAQAPTYYSPYGNHKDALVDRQKLVLRKMLEAGFISQDQYNQAVNEKVAFIPREEGGIKAPHFTMFVRDYLIDKYGEDMVEEGGLKVITTLDYNLQQKAENTVNNFAPALLKNFGASNMGMVAIDPRSGDVVAMIGSKGYFDKTIDGNFNVTTVANRQPGSTFKPFVYATAFKQGYTPSTILFDVRTEFSAQCTPQSVPKNSSAKCYSPDEWDHLFPGPMTMKYALAQSRNIPGVKTLYLAGIKNSLQTAHDLGVQSLNDPDRYGLTLVLGGGEVSLLDMTSAYSVFANDGVRNPYRIVLRVEDSKGNVLDEAQSNPTKVLEPNIAREISDILSDPAVRVESYKDSAAAIGHPVAMKTGTTNDYRDVWTIGYTPSLAVGMWAGNNDNSIIDKEKTAGPVITPVWTSFMTDALKDTAIEYFSAPDPIPQDLKPVLRGYWQGGQSYYIDSASGNLATDQTPLELRKEVIINNVHNILYWVDKDNPQGPLPKNPQSDPQYASWEYAVQKWVNNYSLQHPDFKQTSNVTIPTAKDTIHDSSMAPRVIITNPTPNSTLERNNPVNIGLNISSVSGFPISKAEYYVNGKYLGSSSATPFSISFIPSDIDTLYDNNELKVVVSDSVLNKGEATVNFKVKR